MKDQTTPYLIINGQLSLRTTTPKEEERWPNFEKSYFTCSTSDGLLHLCIKGKREVQQKGERHFCADKKKKNPKRKIFAFS